MTPLRLTLLLLLALPQASAMAAASGTPPNVVFILADDLGWTDLSSFGSDLYQTPHIDRLAREGMRFENAYSACTVCSPTRGAILTGRYPARTRLTDWIPGHVYPNAALAIPEWTQYLDHSYITLAEALQGAGYATGHFGKWHLGDDASHWPEHHGFDVNVGGWGHSSPNTRNGGNGYFSPYGNPRLPDGPDGEHLTARLGREASSFIERNRATPFFLNLWFYAVHIPLQGEPDKVARYTSLVKEGARHRHPVYAAMVESMDDAVGDVLSTLDRLGLASNTLVIFTSDNGGLTQARGEGAPPTTSNHPLRSGKGDRFDGGVRVPLIVRLPGRVKPRTVSSEPVISTDYYPTILSLAGVTVPANAAVDGIDLTPVLEGRESTSRRDSIFWHYPHYHPQGAVPYSAIRKGSWKLIENLETAEIQLYNLAADPGEANDLANAHPTIRQTLVAELHAWRREVDAQMPAQNPAHDPARARELRRTPPRPFAPGDPPSRRTEGAK